ncbi:MAG: PEP-CTERM sorting domain-containing protein [Opitutales bacterium]
MRLRIETGPGARRNRGMMNTPVTPTILPRPRTPVFGGLMMLALSALLIGPGNLPAQETWTGASNNAWNNTGNWNNSTVPEGGGAIAIIPSGSPNSNAIDVQVPFNIATVAEINLGGGTALQGDFFRGNNVLTVNSSGSNTFGNPWYAINGGTVNLVQEDAGTFSITNGRGAPGGSQETEFINFQVNDPAAVIEFSGTSQGAAQKKTRFQGTGTIRATASSILLVGVNNAANQGFFVDDGATLVMNGAINDGSGASEGGSNQYFRVERGGTLYGTGTINNNAPVEIGSTAGGSTSGADGIVDPGEIGSIGTLTFGSGSNITFLANSELATEIDTTGDADRLVTGGSLTLDSGSTLTITGSAIPAGGTYTLAEYSSVSGTFTNVTYNGGSLPGDWSLNYGSSALTLAVAAIPEPATIGALLGLTALGLASHRRKQASMKA